MGNKSELGFVALVSIVIGSQIGSGTFMFPSLLAPFGTIGLLGWIVSVSGAISLALLFSRLSEKLPKNGGPHVYVSEAFGREAGFFTAWVYWIISWSSNSVLLVTTVSYLTVITGELSKIQIITIETLVLFLITFVNILGVKFSGVIEIVLTILKVAPLLIIPFILLLFFDPSLFSFNGISGLGFSNSVAIVSKTALLTFWGFIGVECATTPAERVKNPKKTIPRAICIGTVCVAFIYIANTISVIGVAGFDSLLNESAPYSIVVGRIFGGMHFDLIMAVVAMVVCIGTLNAWTLTGAQIAYGAYEDNLFPKIFGKTNKEKAPIAALLIASFGTIPFFVLQQMDFFSESGLETLINTLVSVFLIIYLACCISYIKLIKSFEGTKRGQVKAYILAGFSLMFCIFVLAENITSTMIAFTVFVLLGIPVFCKNKHGIKINKI